MKGGDGIPDGAIPAEQVLGTPESDFALPGAAEILDDDITNHQQPDTKIDFSANHVATQAPLKQPIQWFKFTAIILLVLAIFFGRSIYDSNFYQRNFNTAEWNVKRQKRAERASAYQELDRQECAIMLRAKAELIPVEIERNKLIGMSDADAVRYANNDYAEEESLCNILR